MDAKKLLDMIESWRIEACPPEALVDAMIDYGIDVEKPYGPDEVISVRKHILGPCSRVPGGRSACSTVETIRYVLEIEIDNTTMCDYSLSQGGF